MSFVERVPPNSTRSGLALAIVLVSMLTTEWHRLVRLKEHVCPDQLLYLQLPTKPRRGDGSGNPNAVLTLALFYPFRTGVIFSGPSTRAVCNTQYMVAVITEDHSKSVQTCHNYLSTCRKIKTGWIYQDFKGEPCWLWPHLAYFVLLVIFCYLGIVLYCHSMWS